MSWRSLAVLVLPVAALAFSAVTACTHTITKEVPDDDDDDDTNTDGGSSSGGALPITMRPNALYTGTDGTHSFRVPFAIYSAGSDLKVTLSDDSVATLAATTLTQPGTDNGKWYMITAKAAGDVKITATSNGQTATGTLHVSSYTADSWTTGQGRYTTGPDANNPPCTTCHSGTNAVDHSPAAIGSVTDEKVGIIITTGLGTDNFPIMIDGKPGHKWSVTSDEETGLITYLRSLDPKGFN